MRTEVSKNGAPQLCSCHPSQSTSKANFACKVNNVAYKVQWLSTYNFAMFSNQLRCFDTVLGTIPNFLIQLLESLLLVRSTWNLHYLLALDWTLAWYTFCENRYFHGNDKQKFLKTVELKFCAIQISFWKANTNILNCGVWQTKYTRTKEFCMFVFM